MTCWPAGTLTFHEIEPEASLAVPISAIMLVGSFDGRATTVQGGALRA